MLTGRYRNTTCSLTPSHKGEMYGGYDVSHSSGMVVSIGGGYIDIEITGYRSVKLKKGDFGDFGVSFVSTVVGRYTRRGGPGRSVRASP